MYLGCAIMVTIITNQVRLSSFFLVANSLPQPTDALRLS